MSTAVEGSPWATRAEATAQQVRRFSRRRSIETDLISPLPPLVRPHQPATSPPLESSPLSPAAAKGAAATRLRASTADVDRPTSDALTAIPSIATLNRDFDRLSRAYAGARSGEANDVPAALMPAAAATHSAGRQSRRTSAPAVTQRPLSEVPMLPPLRVPQRAAPPVSTALPTQDSRDRPPVQSGANLRSSLASLPSLSRPSVPATEMPLPLATPGAADAAGNAQHPLPSQLSAAPQPEKSASSQEKTDASLPPSPQKGRSRSVPATVVTAPSPLPLNNNNKGKGSRDGRIRVVVRKRPLAATEEGPDCVQVSGPHLRIAVTKQRVDLSEYEESSDYTFDEAYDAAATNSDVYATSVADLLTVSLAGGSASVFAYGQTGSGKTFTMMGTETEGGLYLLAAGDLFRRLGPHQQLCVCFYEIYCNSLFDLLNRRHPVVLREDGNRRVNLCGVVWRTVSSQDELWQLMRTGMEQRRTGSTSANEHSSRSHAILSIRISDTNDADFVGTVNFVDLAGSERAADTAANDRLTRLEGAEINKSLLALKECIRALDEKRKHVPFRGSRLTEVLRDSFTGNSKTVMIATVSPSSHNHEHTNNTLRYAFRVKGLSIASVAPSKARNAPRPYIPVSRSKSTAERSNANASPSQEQLQKRRQRRRRHAHRTNTAAAGGTPSDSDATPTSAMDELTAMAEVRARRAAQQQRRGTAADRHDLQALLPRHNERSASQQQEQQRRLAQRPATYKSPPATLLSPNSARSSTSSTFYASARGNVVPLPPIVAVSSPHSSDVVVMDVSVLERRLTQQIMSQLRQDLGRQLEDVLTEKDATIAALRDENALLKRALDQAKRKAAQSDRSLSPQEIVHQQSGGPPRLTGPYPPSPSILHEQTSSGASVSSSSSSSGDLAFHVV